MKTKRIVITGGPGTGKTSVIAELENSNFYCFHEVIRSMTKDAMEKENLDDYTTNPLLFVSDPEEFNIQILKYRIQQYVDGNSRSEKSVFYDRGIPDVLAYMDFFKQVYEKKFTDACKKHVYDQVFIFPPWKEIYISDNERFESFEEATQIHESLLHTYQKYGYNCIEVPFGNIKDRTNFIINSMV